MFDLDDYATRVETNLRRIRLAKDVVEEVSKYLLDPMYPDDKADLLIASEELAQSSFYLMEEVQSLVWGTSPLKSKSPETED
jgi:hypothetical protein